jgi:antitoxin PrlF
VAPRRPSVWTKTCSKQNPEFKQQAEVRADIIGPGKMLISVLGKPETTTEEDPVVAAFLSFIEKHMLHKLSSLTALSAEVISRAKALTAGIVVTDEDFDD